MLQKKNKKEEIRFKSMMDLCTFMIFAGDNILYLCFIIRA